VVHSSSEQLGLNTALNDARRHIKGLRRKLEVMVRKLSKEVWERRINEAGAGRYEFVRWVVDGEFGAKNKCVARCLKDGFEWESTANNITSNGIGCPHCAGNRRWTAEERIEQINKLENVEFVSWVGEYKKHNSKANVRCKIDGFMWTPSVSDLVNAGKGCPQCSGNRRWSSEERILQINSLNNIEFISWVGRYNGKDSIANVMCSKDLFAWSASVNNLVNKGSGCPNCAGQRKWTAEERIAQISELENIEFISWVSYYKNANSKANVRCLIDGFEWSASVDSVVNQGTGCPKCAGYGYQLDKIGYLYALRSECGKYVKVGISNNPSQRHKQLELATPFSFSCIEKFEDDGAKIAEMEKYFHGKYERAVFKGFDGATEWLVCTPDLLEELRNLGDK